MRLISASPFVYPSSFVSWARQLPHATGFSPWYAMRNGESAPFSVLLAALAVIVVLLAVVAIVVRAVVAKAQPEEDTSLHCRSEHSWAAPNPQTII
ncbi:hypothetical protein ACIRPT_24535 [Streptomyces sp. NPDC101227]|uniref:hypothetical protein n=1 Tax=Streptomyces sp. NPDC101227 TaxID=3366136 RepID=UPI00380952CF